MKKYLFSSAALLMGVFCAAFTVQEKTSARDTDVYFHYSGNSLDEGELTTPGNWNYLGTNPEAGCTVGEIPCVVKIDDETLAMQPGASEIDQFISYLDSQGSNVDTYVTGPDKVSGQATEE